MISRTTDGVHTAYALGGDRFPFQTFADCVRLYQSNDDIAMIVLFGEVGTEDELAVAEMIKRGEITKPVVARVVGESHSLLP